MAGKRKVHTAAFKAQVALAALEGDRGHPALSVCRQCELLGLNRSSLYYEPAGETSENLRMTAGFMYLAAVIDWYSF